MKTILAVFAAAAIALALAAPAPARPAPAGSAEVKLGLKEARVQLWRDIQRTMLRRYGDPVYDGSDSFSCTRVSRWRVRCWFSYETASSSYSGYGYVRKYSSGGYYYWWKAS